MLKKVFSALMFVWHKRFSEGSGEVGKKKVRVNLRLQDLKETFRRLLKFYGNTNVGASGWLLKCVLWHSKTNLYLTNETKDRGVTGKYLVLTLSHDSEKHQLCSRMSSHMMKHWFSLEDPRISCEKSANKQVKSEYNRDWVDTWESEVSFEI